MTKSVRKRNEPNDSVEVARQQISETPNLDGDWLNFYLLILLYIIQGFSLGISFALPLILQSKKTVTYNDQVRISAISANKVHEKCIALLCLFITD